MSVASQPPKKGNQRPAGSIPASIIKAAINYLFLMAFCPPQKANDFQQAMKPYRQKLTRLAGVPEQVFFDAILPPACQYIVSFQQASRYPDEALVIDLLTAARLAAEQPDSLPTFQSQWASITALPGRAKSDNRLHRNKGCRLCTSACRYGYFSLVSEPDMTRMQSIIKEEANRLVEQRSPLAALYTFSLLHLVTLSGVKPALIRAEDLAGLSFCLLLLGMAKSRLPVPDTQLHLIQSGNQEYIRRAQSVE